MSAASPWRPLRSRCWRSGSGAPGEARATLHLDRPPTVHLQDRLLLPGRHEVPMRSLLAAVLTGCALALVACEKKASAPPAPPSPAPGGVTAAAPSGGGTPGVTADTILIGEIGSLTGSEATFGISTRNAIELALREVNAAGGVKGKKIEIRVYDNQSKPEEAAQAANRLINQDQVLLILGEVASSNSMAMAEKAQPAKVPMISNASTNPKVTEIGDYIFRVCFIDPFQGYVMAKFARDNLKFTKVAVLRDLGAAYSQG